MVMLGPLWVPWSTGPKLENLIVLVTERLRVSLFDGHFLRNHHRWQTIKLTEAKWSLSPDYLTNNNGKTDAMIWYWHEGPFLDGHSPIKSIEILETSRKRRVWNLSPTYLSNYTDLFKKTPPLLLLDCFTTQPPLKTCHFFLRFRWPTSCPRPSAAWWRQQVLSGDLWHDPMIWMRRGSMRSVRAVELSPYR